MARMQAFILKKKINGAEDMLYTSII
jgi:hypothetical protein